MNNSDKFWKIYWLGAAGIFFLGVSLSILFFFMQTSGRDLAAAVGATFIPDQDPFGTSTHVVIQDPALQRGELYHDALPSQFKSWNWQAESDWTSSDRKFEGTHALKATFSESGGTVGMSGTAVSVTSFKSITFMVWVGTGISDVYFELYDASQAGQGEQSLSWYTGGTLRSGEWVRVSVPLENLLGEGKKSISGFSISTRNGGIVYIDSIELQKTPVQYPRWVPPPAAEWQPYDPFATSTSLMLPYDLELSQENLSLWHTYYGAMRAARNWLEVGPMAYEKGNSSLSVLRGGREWRNYDVTATIEWGESDTFSIVLRFEDELHYAACTFSRYGEMAYIQEIKNGELKTVEESRWRRPRSNYPVRPLIEVRARMKDDEIVCYVDGNELAREDKLEIPSKGSVGISTWREDSDASLHRIRTLRISPLSE